MSDNLDKARGMPIDELLAAHRKMTEDWYARWHASLESPIIADPDPVSALNVDTITLASPSPDLGKVREALDLAALDAAVCTHECPKCGHTESIGDWDISRHVADALAALKELPHG